VPLAIGSLGHDFLQSLAQPVAMLRDALATLLQLSQFDHPSW
jgi:hypothetical protein